MIGLSHFVYLQAATSFVPPWLPWLNAWAWLTGAAHILAGIALLLGVLPRLAITLEAVMLGTIAVLVWVPRLLQASSPDALSPFLISLTIAASAWVVAHSYRHHAWRFDRRVQMSW